MATRYEINHQHRGIDVDGSPALTNPKFGDQSTGGYLEILPTGQLVQRNNAATWNDMNYPFSTGRTSQANFPNWEVMLAPFYAYTFSVNDYIQLAAQEFPHTWQEGSPAKLHVHIITNGLDSTERRIKHEVYATWANAGGAYSTIVMYTKEIIIPANTPDRTHIVSSVADIPMVGGKVGAYIGLRYRRIAATGTAPTKPPFVIAAGLHIRNNTLGSVTEFEKGV